MRYLLEESVERQFNHFMDGFKSVCNSQAFDLLRPEELELVRKEREREREREREERREKREERS